jgi:uncharacterized protein (TIGR02246 family)
VARAYAQSGKGVDWEILNINTGSCSENYHPSSYSGTDIPKTLNNQVIQVTSHSQPTSVSVDPSSLIVVRLWLILRPPVTTDTETIKTVLYAYRDALNASSTDQVIKLYADDGIFMPQHFGTIIGSDAIRGAYDGIFSTIALAVEFEIGEVVITGSDWAFARTKSNGTTKDQANGNVSKEGNQELFVFQKVGGEWKIARYCFCTTNPPK